MSDRPHRGTRRALTVLVVGGATILAAACGDATLKEPKVHRAMVATCVAGRPPGADAATLANTQASCTSDAACTAGTNGRCTGNGHDGYACSYDACSTDAACSGGVCQCDGGRNGEDVCLKTGCHTDADCGEAGKGWCSPTFGTCGNYGGIESYECHTEDDDCTDDADCDGQQGAFGTKGYCAFDRAVGHWKCSTAQCAG